MFFKENTDLKARVAELEGKIAMLEAKITALEQQEKKESPSDKKAAKPSKKDKYIRSVMEKTNWSYADAAAKMEAAKKQFNIKYRDYDVMNLHEVPLGELKMEYDKRLEKRERKKAREEKQEKKKAKYAPIVMAATGWDRETAEAKMDRAMKVAGSSYEHYAIFRFWELTEEEQKTYFTKRDANALRRKYNKDPELVKTLMNKDLCCKKLEAYLGRPWMTTEGMTLEIFKEKFSDEKKIIYKPRASSGGHGIQVIDMASAPIEEIYEQLTGLPDGIIEGYLVQHPEMKKLSMNSVNTIRMVTVQTKEAAPGVEANKVHFVYAGVRMGQGNNCVDNLHSGGMIAAVDVETGIVVTGGVDHTNTERRVHPDTQETIIGFKIPYFKEAKQMIENASKDMPGYFGWDVAITEKGPVIVEVNTSPGADGLQTPYVPQRKGMRHVIEKYL